MYLSFPLLKLSTELLTQILAYLPVVDLFSIQRTCRKIRDIINDTAYLRYILRAQINGVDDLLPHKLPYPERLERLRRHEESWNNLRFNLFNEFATNIPHPNCYLLRGGYLIYEDLTGVVLRYGYTDLCSAIWNEDMHWVHITVDDIRLPLPSKVVFAVDSDLVFSMRKQIGDVLLELSFFEFTTGAHHPLTSVHTVSLPPIAGFDFASADTEVVGDHILVSVRSQGGQASLYLVSWKTGVVTFLRQSSEKWTPLWGGAPKLAVFDSNLIALIKDSANRLEICKLEITASVPRLRTVCFLGLPPLTSDASGVLSAAIREWVPTTSEYYARPTSSWGGRACGPFYSCTVGTIGLLFDYRTYARGAGHPFRCAMIISVAALLAVIDSNVRNVAVTVPWMDWGPSGTRIFEATLLKPAGPFWISDLSPLVVRDYDLLRTRYAQSTAEPEDTSSSHSLSPVLSSTEVFGDHWVARKVKTRLPYRDVVANDLDFRQFSWIMADREWIVGIMALEEGTSVTVYHVD